jgi:hypothetical protein
MKFIVLTPSFSLHPDSNPDDPLPFSFRRKAGTAAPFSPARPFLLRWYNRIKDEYSHVSEVDAMWIKITTDMELMMDVDLQGLDERSRDMDVQLYENVARDALIDRLKKVFAEEDINIHSVDVGIAREKYIKPKAA